MTSSILHCRSVLSSFHHQFFIFGLGNLSSCLFLFFMTIFFFVWQYFCQSRSYADNYDTCVFCLCVTRNGWRGVSASYRVLTGATSTACFSSTWRTKGISQAMPYEEGIFISSEAIVHIEAAFFKLELNITVQVFMNRATFSPIERASARISIQTRTASVSSLLPLSLTLTLSLNWTMLNP